MRRPPLDRLGGAGVSTALLAALLLPSLAAGSAAAGPAAARSTAAPRANVATARVKLQPVVSGLSSPVAIAFRGSDATHMYVAQQTGSIVVVRGGHVLQIVLTLNVAHGSEQGLLGIAFSNDGAKLYVDYNDPSGDIRISQYSMKGLVANAASRRPLLVIPHHTYSNHNGGNLVIGADNMLYVAVGDGGSGGDPNGNGQNKDVMLGKILRIDPRKNGASAFRIPPDNPFRGKPGVVQSIWMYGLRNPWRFSFDRTTHDLWIGDVGQEKYEEIDFARPTQKGVNWGWNRREGFHPYNGGARPAGAHDPIFERPHTAGDCAIIGGYVYRGKPNVPLVGAYVFGDECTGVVRALVQRGGRVVQSSSLGLNVPQLSSFGQGPGGALFALSLTGTIYVFAGA